jgi:hypothetical protein
MQVTRKIAAAAAVATVATLGLATMVSANMLDNPTASSTGLADAASMASKGYGHGGEWYGVHRDGSLAAVDHNAVGPFQACHNFVPINAVGGQVPVEDITGVVGFNQFGNSATAVKTCETTSKNNTGKWYRMGDGGLLSVSGNAVGPFQVCHNEVPVNAVGAQVPVSDLGAILGFNQAGNSVDQLKTCELDSTNN